MIGHNRLAIIDLATGNQPVANETGDVWAAVNGEIYNFRRLREELQGRGHRFRTPWKSALWLTCRWGSSSAAV